MNADYSFEDEIRCEYLVDKKQKQVWKVELDMVSIVDRICKEHNIKYFAICGTMLGAVRHKGFIPWDDDIDLGMLREDYNRFVKYAEKEIEAPYFLQTTLTDNDYYKDYARIRNSNTTAICEHNEFHKCNNGIYIDIFPLDNYYNTPFGNLYYKLSRSLGRLMRVKLHYQMRENPNLKSKVAYFIAKGIDEKRAYKVRERLQTWHSRKRAKYAGITDTYLDKYDASKLAFPREVFDEYQYVPFENIEIPIPKDYDTFLKIFFGDYMSFPPVEERGIHHNIIFDPNTPYKEYIEEHYNM